MTVLRAMKNNEIMRHKLVSVQEKREGSGRKLVLDVFFWGLPDRRSSGAPRPAHAAVAMAPACQRPRVLLLHWNLVVHREEVRAARQSGGGAPLCGARSGRLV